ncbi:uncharacterized protein LOC109822280 [Asparagus officinalis]|uniref:uncharacterized protein LOC109822280 n=1 Tax=Asparagus officinalis TaxID=4686 RepID=UPI00098E1126|nr:uncharacterized protein LOC109822280 [Asparagus officinalis]
MAKSSTPKTLGDKSFKGVANLIKLLPSGTVFIFQFLSPLLTNKGQCTTLNKYLTGALLVLCASSCCFSSFTDSITGTDGRVYYGIVTVNGLRKFIDSGSDSDSGSCFDSKYKLKFGDFVHGFLSLIVFAVVALLSSNIVTCFYPSFELDNTTAMVVLPAAVGGIVSFVFMVFPNTRHGIGYAASERSN